MNKKFNDLSGQKFGKLTVVKRTDNINKTKTHPSGYVAYFCNCECGSTNKVILASSLQSGRTKSCGCLPSIEAENLIGKKFGRLTVIERVDNSYKTTSNPSGLVTYKCKCECGTQNVIVPAIQLKSGNNRSCWCIRLECEDLAGQKFNKLTAIKRIENTGATIKRPHGYVTYECSCECGTINVKVRAKALKDGKIKSCGCIIGGIEAENLVGKKFGKLTVISKVENIGKVKSKPHGHVAYICECECGTTNVLAKAYSLKNGDTQSCGCSSLIQENIVGLFLIKHGFNIAKHVYLQKINNNYPNYFIDYLLENKIIIEYNGEQHYRPVCFGGISYEKAQLNFNNQVDRDRNLEKFCKNNNYILIVIDGQIYRGDKLQTYLEEKILPKINKLLKRINNENS